MFFNSLVFILLFLPVAYLVFRWLVSAGKSSQATLWLALASLFAYGWYRASYVLIILFSLVFNYSVSRLLESAGGAGRRRALVTAGVLVNVLLLGYFKYANFFLDNVNALLGTGASLGEIILPIGISFYTFQQIAFIVDVYRGKVADFSARDYFLFICFFPQFLAGPIVHHSEMLPQLKGGKYQKFDITNLSVGLTLFGLGLFKKVVLADGVGAYADPVFEAAAVKGAVSFADAWAGTLAYTLQIYFDFSAYSDMAIGLGRMFGIDIPVNFNSPYRALNIVDFWRRWHITLSRFLRDYIYLPLGGSRKGRARHLLNIMVVMQLCGLWHGAGWNFVVCGVMHGGYVITYHLWRKSAAGAALRARGGGSRLLNALSWGLTFICVTVAWVLFRTPDLSSAAAMYGSMAGLGGLALHAPGLMPAAGYAWTACLMAAVIVLPNPVQFMRDYIGGVKADTAIMPAIMRGLVWKPGMAPAVATAFMFAFSIMNLSKTTIFMYFNF